MTEFPRIGGSSAERVINCPGSVRLSMRAPDYHDDEFSGPGRVAHKVAEWALEAGFDVDDLVGRTVTVDDKIVEIEPDLAEPVGAYVRCVREHFAAADRSTIQVETRVSLDAFDKALAGTADCSFLSPKEETLYLFDYKHGAGVPVEIEDNPQFKFYGLGRLLTLPDRRISRVKLVVVQPRCDHPDGPIREWETEPEELVAFGFELAEAIEKARGENAPLKTGGWCQFCPVAAAQICPLINAAVQQAEKFETQDALTADQGGEIDPDEVGRRLALIEPLKVWMTTMRRYAWAEAQRGRVPTGYKLVKIRGRLRWQDGEIAMRQAVRSFADVEEDRLYKRTPITPRQFEKLVGAKNATDFLEANTTKNKALTLAPLSDKREAVPPDLISDFADVLEEGPNGEA